MHSVIKSAALLLLTSLLLFSGCSGDKGPRLPYGTYSNEIIKSENKMIRGVAIGDIKEVVINAESKKEAMIESDEKYCIFEYKIDSLVEYTVEYNFNEDTLIDLKIDIYCVNFHDARTIYEDLKSCFDTRFGNAILEPGIISWVFNKCRIELDDESAEYGKGKISVLMYKDYYFETPSI